jgi:CRISPR-associated protein Cmr3
MQGVIRSKVLADKGVSYADYAAGKVAVPEIGYSDNYGQLQQRGPLIAHEENGQIIRYFTLPADVAKAGCPHPIALAPLPAVEVPFENNLSVAAGMCPLWERTTAHLTSIDNGWLSEPELQRYLSGQPFSVTQEIQLLDRESRFHVEIDSQAKRPYQGERGGHLFQIEFVRLKPGIGLWVEEDGITLSAPGMLQIGGEGKAAHYREVSLVPSLTAGGTARGRFKLYFATPAYFVSGWQPNDWNQFITGGSVKLVAAAVPRPQAIGGFDMARKKHKPMHRFVPAGSVFFFESDHQVMIPEVITDDDGLVRLGQIGFGQVFVGRWDYV